MKKGRVLITPILIKEALKFPDDWEIESMVSTYKHGHHLIEAIISGEDFPEEPTQEGEPIKKCMLKIRKRRELVYGVDEV